MKVLQTMKCVTVVSGNTDKIEPFFQGKWLHEFSELFSGAAYPNGNQDLALP
jgi:hypothetical protein